MREESWENQVAISFPAFQPGLKFLSDSMRFFSARGANSAWVENSSLVCQARVENPSLVCQTRLGFSARAEKSPCNDNLILRGFVSEAGLKFQPG